MNVKHVKVGVLIVYFVICGVFLHYFNRYQEKPGYGTWRLLQRYLLRLKTQGKYKNEPIIFNPGWLRNYATDRGLLKDFNTRESRGEQKVFWLVTFEEDRDTMASDYLVLNEKRIEGRQRGVVIMKLRVKNI